MWAESIWIWLISNKSVQPQSHCQPGPSCTNKPSNQTRFSRGLCQDLSQHRICRRDETFIYSFSSLLNISSSSFLLSYVCFFFSAFFPFSLSFFLLSLSLLITETRLLGFLAFCFSGEKKKKGGEGRRRRKAPLSAPLLLLHGTGRTKLSLTGRIALISTQATCHHPVSSLQTRVVFSLSVTDPPQPVRITQYAEKMCSGRNSKAAAYAVCH